MMRKKDYTIFEYRMGKEIKFTDLIVNEKVNGFLKKYVFELKMLVISICLFIAL